MFLAINTSNVIVNLNSPGGLVDDGLLIAEQIVSSKYDTYVSGASECLSMCGVIWLSGARRYLAADGSVGFHGAYIENEQGTYSVSGPGNAKIGAFLGRINVSQMAVSFVTNAQPEDIAFVGFSEAEALGLEPKSTNLDLFEKQRETIDPIASIKTAANIAFYDTACLNILKDPPKNLDVYYDFYVNSAKEALGRSLAGKELDLALIEINGAMREHGQILYCIEAEKVIRSANVPTGIFGPSFNCAEHTSDVHQTICATPALWAPDIVMNSIYWNVRENGTIVKDVKAFIARQRQWITMRDGCGSDVECIEDIYVFRLKEITKQVAGQ